MNIKGTLIPIGGNEDKGNEESETTTLEYIQESILSRVVQESGGKNSLIVIIPTASSIPKELSAMYLDAFGKLGCTNIHIMPIITREDAETDHFLKLMKKADCVMFTGGDQSRIVKAIGGTVMELLIKEKYENEKFVIAGTSAGAMCMSKNMISGGGKKEVLLKGAVRMRDGLGLIPNFIIDSHFIQRRRFGRLAEAVARFPNRIGIGLAEDTGLVIKNGNQCEVIGSGMMILFDPNDLIYNDEAMIEDGAPITITNLKTHILANGNKLSVDKNKIIVSPENIIAEKV